MVAMKIGVDLDGVVYDFQQSFASYYAHTHATALPLPPQTLWHYWEQEDSPLTEDEWMGNLRDGIANEWMYYTGDLMPGTCVALWQLYDAGHHIHIVTHRSFPGLNLECRWATESWLARMELPHHDLSILSIHHGNKTGFDLDVLLDDRVENLVAAREAGEMAICFDAPYNQHWDGARVNGWDEFVRAMEFMA